MTKPKISSKLSCLDDDAVTKLAFTFTKTEDSDFYEYIGRIENEDSSQTFTIAKDEELKKAFNVKKSGEKYNIFLFTKSGHYKSDAINKSCAVRPKPIENMEFKYLIKSKTINASWRTPSGIFDNYCIVRTPSFESLPKKCIRSLSNEKSWSNIDQNRTYFFTAWTVSGGRMSKKETFNFTTEISSITCLYPNSTSKLGFSFTKTSYSDFEAYNVQITTAKGGLLKNYSIPKNGERERVIYDVDGIESGATYKITLRTVHEGIFEGF